MLTKDHTVLCATHTFIHKWNEPYLPLLPSCRASPHFGRYSFSVPLRVEGRDLRSFEIRFDFESNFRFGIRFVVMILFEIFESSAPSIVLCKETIGGG